MENYLRDYIEDGIRFLKLIKHINTLDIYKLLVFLIA
jgi:hypothetical protein